MAATYFTSRKDRTQRHARPESYRMSHRLYRSCNTVGKISTRRRSVIFCCTQSEILVSDISRLMQGRNTSAFFDYMPPSPRLPSSRALLIPSPVLSSNAHPSSQPSNANSASAPSMNPPCSNLTLPATSPSFGSNVRPEHISVRSACTWD